MSNVESPTGTRTVQVVVQGDHLQALGRARDPVSAISELVWNGLDEDATDVRVQLVSNNLDGLELIRVTDNGNGMPYDEGIRAFGSLGGSSKRQRTRTPGGRLRHGKLGKGRFRAFALGERIEWNSNYSAGSELKAFSVTGRRDQPGRFEFTPPQPAAGSTGVSVEITNLDHKFTRLEHQGAIDAITKQFALYLRQYPEIKLWYDGSLVDPETVEDFVADYPLDGILLADGRTIDAALTVIEWKIPTDRAIYLCDENGFTLGEAAPGIHASGFSFTAYLKSAHLRAEVYAEEEKIHHNIRALANCIRVRLPGASRPFVHLFVTSNDIMDTARSLAFRDVVREVVLPDLHSLLGTIVAIARDNADTLQIGRTHGRHAVPLTLGYWLANYIDRLGQRIEHIVASTGNLRGMVSGAVGAHNSFALHWQSDPALFEQKMLERLGLRASDSAISTQVVQPEFVTDFAHSIVSTFSVLANMADDYRNLMRSEIEEVGENDTYRVGSSTMPHKVNPKNFENVKSLWKAFMPRMTTVYMDQISEHQRDLTNSASSRFLNELIAGFDYAVRRLDKAIRGTVVNIDSLKRNFELGQQWTVAEPLYIALALSGDQDAYETSKNLVKKCRDAGVGLLDYLLSPSGGPTIDRLSPNLQRIVLAPEEYLGDAPSRTLFVCDTWWGVLGEHPGRANPLKSLTDRLTRPHNDVALIACRVSY